MNNYIEENKDLTKYLLKNFYLNFMNEDSPLLRKIQLIYSLNNLNEQLDKTNKLLNWAKQNNLSLNVKLYANNCENEVLNFLLKDDIIENIELHTSEKFIPSINSEKIKYIIDISDEFYLNYNFNKLFEIYSSYNHLFQINISPNNCKWWLDNYIELISAIITNNEDLNNIIISESKCSDWNDNNIEDFLKLIDTLVNITYKMLAKEDINTFRNIIYSNTPILKMITFNKSENKFECDIQSSIIINMTTDLVQPCNKCNDKCYSYFKIIYNNNSIEDIEIKNVELFNFITLVNPNLGMIGCDQCKCKYLCNKSCLYEQLKYSKDILFINKPYCDLIKEKILYLLGKYKEMKTLDFSLDYIRDTLFLYNQIDLGQSINLLSNDY